MKRCLIIYNICGLSGKDNYTVYREALRLILMQNGIGTEDEVIVSGCMVQEHVKKKMIDEYGKRCHFLWIDESLPLNVTFNKAVIEGEKLLGPFRTFLYVAADVFMRDPIYGSNSGMEVQCLVEDLESGPIGMLCPTMQHDTGYHFWKWDPIPGHIRTLAVGQAVNGHCVLFSRKLFEAYGKTFSDIFCNHTSESVWSFLCAAIKLNLAITGRVTFANLVSLDGPSVGWRHQFLFHEPRSMQQIYAEGKAFGFGWEEVQPALGCLHDPAQFDEKGFSINEKLYPFIRDNLYLSKEKFDYDGIKSEWI